MNSDTLWWRIVGEFTTRFHIARARRCACGGRSQRGGTLVGHSPPPPPDVRHMYLLSDRFGHPGSLRCTQTRGTPEGSSHLAARASGGTARSIARGPASSSLVHLSHLGSRPAPHLASQQTLSSQRAFLSAPTSRWRLGAAPDSGARQVSVNMASAAPPNEWELFAQSVVGEWEGRCGAFLGAPPRAPVPVVSCTIYVYILHVWYAMLNSPPLPPPLFAPQHRNLCRGQRRARADDATSSGAARPLRAGRLPGVGPRAV